MAKDRMDVLELLRAHVQGAVVCRIPARPQIPQLFIAIAQPAALNRRPCVSDACRCPELA